MTVARKPDLLEAGFGPLGNTETVHGDKHWDLLTLPDDGSIARCNMVEIEIHSAYSLTARSNRNRCPHKHYFCSVGFLTSTTGNELIAIVVASSIVLSGLFLQTSRTVGSTIASPSVRDGS